MNGHRSCVARVGPRVPQAQIGRDDPCVVQVAADGVEAKERCRLLLPSVVRSHLQHVTAGVVRIVRGLHVGTRIGADTRHLDRRVHPDRVDTLGSTEPPRIEGHHEDLLAGFLGQCIGDAGRDGTLVGPLTQVGVLHPTSGHPAALNAGLVDEEHVPVPVELRREAVQREREPPLAGRVLVLEDQGLLDGFRARDELDVGGLPHIRVSDRVALNLAAGVRGPLDAVPDGELAVHAQTNERVAVRVLGEEERIFGGTRLPAGAGRAHRPGAHRARE